MARTKKNGGEGEGGREGGLCARAASGSDPRITAAHLVSGRPTDRDRRDGRSRSQNEKPENHIFMKKRKTFFMAQSLPSFLPSRERREGGKVKR